MKSKRSADSFSVAFLTAFVACIGIVGFTVKGDAQPIWEWLHDWQTLAAGALALSGAAFTIWKMQQANQIAERINSDREKIRLHTEISYGVAAMRDLNAIAKIFDIYLANIESGEKKFETTNEGFFSNKTTAFERNVDPMLFRELELFYKVINELSEEFKKPDEFYNDSKKITNLFVRMRAWSTEAKRLTGIIFQNVVEPRIEILLLHGEKLEDIEERYKLSSDGRLISNYELDHLKPVGSMVIDHLLREKEALFKSEK